MFVKLKILMQCISGIRGSQKLTKLVWSVWLALLKLGRYQDEFTMRIYPNLPINSLAPKRFQFNIRKVIFKPTLANRGWSISYEIAFGWMQQDLTDDKSTLVKVMAWCRQATSHYLSQCWPRSRPQWVKSSSIVLVNTSQRWCETHQIWHT